MHLNQKVKKNIQDNPLFIRGATIIVGTSGGPDSTALTHILHNLQYELGFHLHIAHYNHNLHRGANQDQKFVEQLAVHLNVPCSVARWSNPKSLKKGSIEDAARAYDRGERCDMEAGMAKLFASEAAMENASECMRIHGAYGYSKELHVERYYRDAPLMCIGEGTNEMQRIIIAKQLMQRNPV